MDDQTNALPFLRIKPILNLEGVGNIIELDKAFSYHNLNAISVRIRVDEKEKIVYEPEPDGTFLINFLISDAPRDMAVAKALIEFYEFEIIGQEPYYPREE